MQEGCNTAESSTAGNLMAACSIHQTESPAAEGIPTQALMAVVEGSS